MVNGRTSKRDATVRCKAVLLLFCLSASVTSAGETTNDSLPKLLSGSPPKSVADLKVLQARIHKLTDKLFKCTVAVQVGRANGSGVIISPDGYVLTAAHVAGTPNRPATISISGRQPVHGVTLGLNEKLDAGLIKISDPGKWPYAPLGKSSKLKVGQWCLATGHPGGFDQQRPPVLRMGRILKTDRSAILSDCTLVGGDSGGPLFDLRGKVIGVHSRIGKNLTINVHVPVDPYRDSWTRLVKGEAWGFLEPENRAGWVGVTEDQLASDARISQVVSESPAERAGLRPGDVVIQFDGVQIDQFSTLHKEVSRRAAGQTVKIQVRRGGSIYEYNVRIGTRPDAHK